MKVEITDHAYERAAERLNWNRAMLNRMSLIAFEEGIPHSATAGRLNRYITKLYMQERSANATRIFGEHVYIFSGTKLITLFGLPHEFKSVCSKLRSHKPSPPSPLRGNQTS